MKKLAYILMLGGSLSMASCVDDLDQSPIIETTASSVYTSAANYEMVMAKLYALYSTAGQNIGGGNADLSSNTGYDYYRMMFALQEASTDEMVTTWLEGDKFYGLLGMSWDANDVWVTDMYYRCYYTITMINEFIRNASDDAISGFSAEEQAQIRKFRAEARYLRAFTYSHVLDLFRKGPFVTENDPVGAFVPKVADAKELFSYITTELKECAEEMSSRAEAVYGRAPRAAAWALLARVSLNAEVYIGEDKYSDVITYCKKVIEEGYSLEPEFAKLFNADNHKRTNEIIYHIVVDQTEVVSWGATTNLVCGAASNDNAADTYNVNELWGVSSGWSNYRVRKAAYDKFADADGRKMFFTDGMTLEVTQASNALHGALLTKWTNLTDNGIDSTLMSNTASYGVNTDFPVFRLADVYLMLAEAVVRGGEGATMSEALGYVNAVRERAYGNTDGNISEGQLNLDFLLDERCRELMWEMVRRTDLIRFGKFTTADYTWDLKPAGVADKFNYFPIPNSELSANPNLSNPEY